MRRVQRFLTEISSGLLLRHRALEPATPGETASVESTKVTWSFDGSNVYMMKVMGLFMNMDHLMGKHFEDGLANLKAPRRNDARGEGEGDDKGHGNATATTKATAFEAGSSSLRSLRMTTRSGGNGKCKPTHYGRAGFQPRRKVGAQRFPFGGLLAEPFALVRMVGPDALRWTVPQGMCWLGAWSYFWDWTRGRAPMSCRSIMPWMRRSI
jgi:hypothetical protein